MKALQKAAYIATGAAAVIGVGMGVSAASAHMNSGDLAANLATKLNTSTETVQTALDGVRTEQRTARKAEMQTSYEAKLTQAVTDGKITAEQKTKLIEKQKEVSTKMDELKAQMETLQSDTQKWATENGIDSSYLPMGGMGGPGGRGHGGPGMMR